MVSRHRLAAIAALTSVALVVGLGVLVMSLTVGPDGPKSRYGDPALDAIVALPEQLYSPPSPDESSRDAAKRVENLVTPDLFAAMSSPRERETNYRMAVVAREQGTVRAQAYIDDIGVRNGADSPNSVSRTVIVVQKISFPGGRIWEDRFGVIVDVTPLNGAWKAKSFAPAPLLDALALTPPPPPTPSSEPPPSPPASTEAPPPPPPATAPPAAPSTAAPPPPSPTVAPKPRGPRSTTRNGPIYRPPKFHPPAPPLGGGGGASLVAGGGGGGGGRRTWRRVRRRDRQRVQIATDPFASPQPGPQQPADHPVTAPTTAPQTTRAGPLPYLQRRQPRRHRHRQLQ
jgi:hypothetical protein